MFAPIPTFAAIIACLIGLDMAHEGTGPALSAWALVAFAVVPAGELSLLQARLKRRRGKKNAQPFWYMMLSILPPGGYAAACLLFGFPRIVFELGIENWFVLDEALLLAPYPAAAALGRIYRHRRSRVFRPGRTWRQCRTEIVLGFRGEIAFMIPLLIFVLMGDLLSLSPDLEKAVGESPVLFYGFLALCLLLIVTFYPVVLKILWRMKPLPAGLPPREELVAFMRERGFRARDIVVWQTGGLMANAAILGFLPRLRYILLTDSLLKIFRSEELKAVVAHEIGHGKRRHSLLLIIFSVAFIALLGLLENRFDIVETLENDIIAAGLYYLPAVAAFVWLVFGYVSRRLEVEADVYAVRALDDPGVFANTLRRLGGMTAAARPRRGWRHFTLDRRVELIEEFFPEGAALPGAMLPEAAAGGPAPGAPPSGMQASEALLRFERRMRRLKTFGVAVSLLIIGLFVADLLLA